jgi:lipid A 3-O-deacylase
MQKLATLARLGLLAALMVSTHGVHAQTNPEKWEFGVDLGYLKKVKHGTPLDYEIVPTQLVWRTPVVRELWRGSSGASLTLRHRLAFVYETYLEGAEDYYVGFSGSPVFELWTPDRKTALFYEIGGGSGFTNAKGVTGGQGQDFAFNFFTQLGLRRQLTPNMAVTGGAYFLHHSNLGMTKPNPGIDVLGVNVGLVWQLD